MKYFIANLLWFLANLGGIITETLDNIILKLVVGLTSLSIFLLIYYRWGHQKEREAGE